MTGQLGGPSRLNTLLADLAALYPGADARLGPADVSVAGAAVRQFRVVPSIRRPRAAVPVDTAGAVRSFLRRDSAADRRYQHIVRRAVAEVAAGPFARLVFPATITVGPTGPDSIEAYLAEVTGGPVRLSLATGAVRSNAKPVLGVTTVDGEELGFCKVGLSTLASHLVGHEAAVLGRLSGHLRSLVLPPALHSSQWQGHAVLFMGVVRGTRGRGAELPVDAMREVAAADTAEWREPSTSPWVDSVRQRASAAPPNVTRTILGLLARLLERTERTGLHEVLHGASHGDWGPWNMAWNGSRVVLWDWERYQTGMPIGLDAVHFLAHKELRRRSNRADMVAMLDRQVEPAVRTVLAGWPATDHDRAAAAHFVVDAYLLEVACRFAVDANAVSAAPVAQLADWYLSVAADRLGTDVDHLGVVVPPTTVEPEAQGR